jgi:hypothetical protein
MKLTPQEDRVATSEGGSDVHPALSFDRNSTHSGIVVFSSTRKALYVNQGAQQLLSRYHRQDNGHSPNDAIPSEVDDLLDEMLSMLQTAGLNQGWRDLKARRLIAAQERTMLLKAYGIPDRTDVQQFVIVVTIQEILPGAAPQ